jgi:hypothetical protein
MFLNDDKVERPEIGGDVHDAHFAQFDIRQTERRDRGSTLVYLPPRQIDTRELSQGQ